MDERIDPDEPWDGDDGSELEAEIMQADHAFGAELKGTPRRKLAHDATKGGPDLGICLVGARGFEPLTSSVSRKRSPPELSARALIVAGLEAGTGIEPVCEALQASA